MDPETCHCGADAQWKMRGGALLCNTHYRELVPEIPSPVFHIAGKPNGLIQECRNCEYLLQDYRNTSAPNEPDGSPPRLGFWEEEALVEVLEGNPRSMSLLGLDGSYPPLCTPNFRWDHAKMLGSCLHCGRRPAQGHSYYPDNMEHGCRGIAKLVADYRERRRERLAANARKVGN